MRKILGAGFVAANLFVAMAVQSFAAFDYTNTFNTVGGELTTALEAIVPLVLVVFALVLAIRLGLRLFRSVAR